MASRSLYTNKLQAESKDAEILKLKARIYDCQVENENLRRQLDEARAELKETQALLGQAFVSARGKQKEFVLNENPAIPSVQEPVVKEQENEFERVPKRTRSPSIEIIETPMFFRDEPAARKYADPMLKHTKVAAKVEPTVMDIDLPIDLPSIQPPSSPPPPPPSSSPLTPADIAAHSTTSSNEEENGRAIKRPKLEGTSQALDVNSFGTNSTLAVRTAPERASVEAGAVVALIDIKPAQDSSVKAAEQEDDEVVNMPILPTEDIQKVDPGEIQEIPAVSSSIEDVKILETKRRPPQKSSKSALTLSPSVAETYLGPIAPLAVNPPPLDLEVPRAFLRVAYGGSDQHFLQYIPPERNPSGPVRRRLVFPTLALNPLMPNVPGMHGLVFASRREILNDGPWTVFCKQSAASPTVWLYVGEYVNTLAGTMKAEEFRQQTPLVQREWATQLMECKMHDVYVSMRARIALRKAGKLPVTDKAGAERELEEMRLVDGEIVAVKGGRGHCVDKEDIVEAFCKGEEAIDVVRMQCVEYDHVFAEDMRTRLPTYPALLRANKQKKNAGKGKRKAGVVTTGTRGKKASIKDEDWESDGEDDIHADSGDDFEGPQSGLQAVHRQYGTRSRRSRS